MSSFDFLAHDLLERDLVFAFGGYDGKQALATTEVFSLATSRWEPGPPMRAGRRSFGTAVHRNWLFVIGGYNDGCLASVEFLSLPACTWREGPRLATKRRDLAVAASNGLIYALGGSSDGQLLDSVEILDVAGWKWGPGPPLPTARASLGAAAHGGRIFAIGGNVGRSSIDPISLVDALDPAARRWEQCPPMTTRRCDLGVAVLGEALVAVGGYGGRHAVGGGGGYLDTMELLSVAEEHWGHWEPGPPMALARAGMGVTVRGALLLVMGGPFAGTGSTTTEIFDSSAWEWRAGPDLPTRRWGMCVAAHNSPATTERQEELERQTEARCDITGALASGDSGLVLAAVAKGETAGLQPRELEAARDAGLQQHAAPGT